MGEFSSWVTDGRQWSEDDPPGAYSLRVTVHDSSVGALEYVPAGPGSGLAYAGVTARTYFEDESIPATNKEREVRGLVAWFRGVGVTLPDMDARVRDLLVGEGEESDEAFVDEELAEFFEGIGLPLPDQPD